MRRGQLSVRKVCRNPSSASCRRCQEHAEFALDRRLPATQTKRMAMLTEGIPNAALVPGCECADACQLVSTWRSLRQDRAQRGWEKTTCILL